MCVYVCVSVRACVCVYVCECARACVCVCVSFLCMPSLPSGVCMMLAERRDVMYIISDCTRPYHYQHDVRYMTVL